MPATTVDLDPQDNLYRYTANAILPQMRYMPGARAPPKPPKPGHKSHRNLLRVRPQHWRMLTSSYKLKLSVFKKFVLKWHETNFPKEPVRVELKQDHIGIASTGFNVKATRLMNVANLNKICDWVQMIVMHTARALLHSAYPDTLPWTVCSEDTRHREKDDHLIREVYMLNRNMEATPDPYNNTLTPIMVFVQAPWVLSPKDFELLTSRRTLDALIVKPGESVKRLKSSERLWGKIWDHCTAMKSYWFVVTSYEQWAFGRFSDGWSAVFITPPMSWDSTEPTILQSLTCWMMSSIDSRKAFKEPEGVNDAINNAVDLIPAVQMAEDVEYFASQIDSDSEWEGQSEEPISIHGSEYREMDDLSEVTVREKRKKGKGKLKESMPGEYREDGEGNVIEMIEEHVPAMDRGDFIDDWRTHPLVPTLGEDDERRPKAGRIDLWAEYRARVNLGERGWDREERSEWTVMPEPEVEEVEGEDTHGEFMKMRPEENVGPDFGGMIDGMPSNAFNGRHATAHQRR